MGGVVGLSVVKVHSVQNISFRQVTISLRNGVPVIIIRYYAKKKKNHGSHSS